MKLPEFSVKQPVAALMIFLGLILIGSLCLFKLNIDMLPEINPPVISILTTWPGASASDVESEVTRPIEDHVNGVNNLDELTSKSLDNLSVVSCKFNWGTNLSVAINDVRDKLGLAKRDMPDDAETPMIFKFSSASAPILFMNITGDRTWPRLYRLVDKHISDELKRVPGVGAIILYGGLRRRINVYFDLAKIEGYKLSLLKINKILAAENMNIPAGNIKSGLHEYFVRVPSRYKTMDDIRNTIIGSFKGNPVYLKNVGKVTDSYKPRDINGWGDGKKGIILILQKQAGKNTVEVIDRIKAKLAEINKTLPSDVQINITTDNAENIKTSIKNLRASLLWGIFFVVLVTIIFLRRFKASIIIALTIPFSLIIAFIFLYIGKYTINLVSLMSLAIASGMVVDNGIVVLENIVRYLDKGLSPENAAITGASEMGMAITASSMTTVVVFVPLMFLSGLAGIIFKQLGFVIIVTILGSLFTALTMTPMLSSKWVRSFKTAKSGKDVLSEKNSAAENTGEITKNIENTKTGEISQTGEDTGIREDDDPAEILENKEQNSLNPRMGFMAKLYQISENGFNSVERGYEYLLTWALGHRKSVIVLSIAVFLSSISLIPFLSTSFLPATDTGDVDVTFRLSEGTRIEETNRVVEAILKNIDTIVKPGEMRHSYGFDGQSEKGYGVALGFDEGPNCGEVGFKLVDRDKRNRSAKGIAALLRKRVNQIPGVSKIKVRAQDMMTSALMGSGSKPVSVELQGSDLDQLIVFAHKLKKRMEEIPGLVDIDLNQKDQRPELWVKIDRAKASMLGISTALISATLRNYFYGNKACEFTDGGDRFDIFTRLADKDKDNLDKLLDSPVFTQDGRMIRLKNVARVVNGMGPIEIQRKNRQKIVTVDADLFKKSLGNANSDIKELLKKMEIPDNISISFGGDIEEQHKAFKSLTELLILGIILVYMVMASLFGNLRGPFIIMFSLPFAFSGVFYAFYFFHVTLGLISFMGIIMLIGIVVNNAIVLLDYTHILQKRGEKVFQAVTHAGRNRLRPVLMTTFTTLFGMIPMAVSSGVGAEVWNPLGITMVGGLLVSTLVTMILIPVIYYQFERKKEEITDES